MRKLKTIIHQHVGNINMQKLPKLQSLSVLSLIHTQDVPSDPKVLAFTIVLVASGLYLALIITILHHNKLHELGARYELASYPGSRWAGKERAWYPLFAHALNFPEILGNRKLLCYIRITVTT